MGRVEGQVALITGAARGQGRSHALALAKEGVDIIGLDMRRPLASAIYDLATPDDLAETRKAVEALGRRCLTFEADIRDDQQLAEAFRQGVEAVGPVDIVLANAGVALFAVDEAHEVWQDTLDINLTGVFNALETVVPSMVERGAGGAVVLTSSTAGPRGILSGSWAALAYAASKLGLVGLMRSYANNLAAHSIRVNSINPTGVETPMITAESIGALVDANPHLAADITNPMPVGLFDFQGHQLGSCVSRLRGRALHHRNDPSVDAGFNNKI